MNTIVKLSTFDGILPEPSVEIGSMESHLTGKNYYLIFYQKMLI